MPDQEPWTAAYRTSTLTGYAVAASLAVWAVIVEVLQFREISWRLIPAPLLDTLRFVLVFLSFGAYFVIDFCRKKLLIRTPADTLADRLRRLTQVNLVSLALAELPALFGLLLFLGSGNPRDFYPLLLIAALLLYCFFPRAALWAGYSRVQAPPAPS